MSRIPTSSCLLRKENVPGPDNPQVAFAFPSSCTSSFMPAVSWLYGTKEINMEYFCLIYKYINLQILECIRFL